MMNKVIYSLFICSLVILGACGEKNNNAQKLESHPWQLTGIDTIITNQGAFTIHFSPADSSIFGEGVCNRFMGRFELTGTDKITIRVNGSTMMACPHLELEQPYFEMLNKADKYNIENDTLILYSDKNVLGKFIPYTEKSDGHTAENALDYWGEYKGTLPAADCPGINVTLVLNQDKSYTLTMQYIDRNTTFTQKGIYTLDGNMLTLQSSDQNDQLQYYTVGENKLTQLDAEKQPITGELASYYVLTKQP